MHSSHTLRALRSFKTGSLGSQSVMKTIRHGTWNIGVSVLIIGQKERICHISASTTLELIQSRNF